MHKVDPYIWLVDVLQRIAIHPARDVAQLTPRLWKQHFAANPLTSDIGKGVPGTRAQIRGLNVTTHTEQRPKAPGYSSATPG